MLLLTACETTETADSGPREVPAPRATPMETPPVETPPPAGVTRLDGFDVVHSSWNSLGYRWDWAGTPVLSRGGVLEFVDAYHDRIVAQESGSVISVLDPRSGALLWSADLPGRASRLVGNVRVDDSLFSTTETDLFEIDINTGNLLDRRALTNVVNTPPVIIDNLAIFGTSAGEVLAYNRSFGVDVWKYALNGPIQAEPIRIDDRDVAFVSQVGDVVFLDVLTGRAKGRQRISGGLANDPITDGYRLFIASEDQSVYAFDASTGERLWRHRTSRPLRTQPVYWQNVIYYSSVADGLVALNGDNGEPLWSLPELGNAWVVGMRDGLLVTWDGRTASTVDPEFGDVVTSVELPGVRGLRTDRFVDGNLYAVAGTGKILRFSPR
ncbi:MAG: PQQ-binding-like beta-propeller repeat protein [Phycisphaerales bacterium]